MKLYKEKILTGAAVLLLSLLMHRLAVTQIGEASLAGVSPRAVPLLVTRSIAVLALVIMGRGILQGVLERKRSGWARSSVRFHSYPFLIFGLMLAYALAMAVVGYMIASFTVLPLMMAVLGVLKVRNYLMMGGVVLFIFLLMDVVLRIRLPKIGLLGIL